MARGRPCGSGAAAPRPSCRRGSRPPPAPSPPPAYLPPSFARTARNGPLSLPFFLLRGEKQKTTTAQARPRERGGLNREIIRGNTAMGEEDRFVIRVSVESQTGHCAVRSLSSEAEHRRRRESAKRTRGKGMGGARLRGLAGFACRVGESRATVSRFLFFPTFPVRPESNLHRAAEFTVLLFFPDGNNTSFRRRKIVLYEVLWNRPPSFFFKCRVLVTYTRTLYIYSHLFFFGSGRSSWIVNRIKKWG
jgi:hypothetical protein